MTAAQTPERRARVDAFVRRHYRLRGTLRLHRHALGRDLLRAPLNVSLAPVFLAVRLLALLARAVRLRGAARWLAGRRILLETQVARRVETLVLDELCGGAAGADGRVRRLVSDYAAVRSPVAEITVSLTILAAGFLLFHVATPGIVSLAPMVSDRVAWSTAVADFPLGQRLGSVWYGVFPVHRPLWFVVAVGVALALLASLLTTFAGLVADPVQARLGLHRRRLLRLLADVDRARAGATPAPRTAAEHILARLSDIADAGLSALRALIP